MRFIVASDRLSGQALFAPLPAAAAVRAERRGHGGGHGTIEFKGNPDHLPQGRKGNHASVVTTPSRP
ncbi:MAG TPA: hypothetical protein VH912_29275 [Streptosporangiaceae bacterium]|jgi:hypothetical protein